ncbi:MAG: hypothetical protein GC162_17535 [Planctomycetes bacterium]|nr:hypothetical protein [Planctomycetota bacterium]
MDQVRLQYGYDRNSNRLWRENPVASGFSSPQDQLYAYDPINRLTNMQRGTLNGGHTAVSPLTFEQQWGLDAVGNWATFDQDSSGGGFDLQQQRTHNKVNEITDIAETTGPSWPTPGYDAAGNTNDFPQPNDPTARYQAVYDAWNRLVKLTDPATGDTIAEYQYDGLNRRTIKTPYASNVAQPPEHQYYTANWQLIETRKGESTTPESQYVWGVRYIDDLILLDRDADASGELDERLYALQDANYNVSAIVDDAGDVQERYEYDAYGAVGYFSDDYTPRSSSDFDWSITYCGYRLDPGTGLYLVRNRTYHTALGRWLQRDPLGYVDGMNSYQYTNCRPTVAIDSLGLFEIDFHYYVIYYLLRAKCWSASEADNVAGFSQYVDDNPATEPEWTGYMNRQCFHFPGSGPDSPTVANDSYAYDQVVQACWNYEGGGYGVTARLGAALHTYADTWAHDGFTAWWNDRLNTVTGSGRPNIGHADAAEGGHAPDRPYNDIGRALDAARSIYDLIPDHCCTKGSSPMPWEDISEDLRHSFNVRNIVINMSYDENVKYREHVMQLTIKRRFGDDAKYDRQCFDKFKSYFETSVGIK